MTQRKTVWFGVTVVALAVAGYSCFMILKLASVHADNAVLALGQAALVYMKENKTPPQSIDELIAAGLLVEEDGLMGLGYHARADEVRRLRLSFPSSAEGLSIDGRRLVDTRTGEEVQVIKRVGGLVPVNIGGPARYISRAWYNLVTQGATGDQFLDRLPPTSVPTSSRPRD